MVIKVPKFSHALYSHVFSFPFQPVQCKPPQSASPYQSLYYGYQKQHSYEQNDEGNGEEYWVVRGGRVTVGGSRGGDRLLGLIFFATVTSEKLRLHRT
jgi:hypothetical protein